ncbi:MAG: hypothetical protein IJ716_14315 [Lachnospiraceae bacterium]|nr:hypothetical protein [Lachnospiraceae bacterium]
MPIKIVIKPKELWDEIGNQFIYQGKETTLTLEHSLVSLSKWEAKWHKPFLDKNEKTTEETLDYIKCMTLTQNVDPEVYDRIKPEHIKAILAYIDDPMTATWFKEDEEKHIEKRTITAEVIYYQMIALNIPVEFQKWHINRLLTLIRVCNEENKPKKKKSKRQILEEQHALNKKRRAAQKAKKKGR